MIWNQNSEKRRAWQIKNIILDVSICYRNLNVGDNPSDGKPQVTKSKWVSAARKASEKRNPVKASILGIGVKTAGLVQQFGCM